MNKQPIMLVIDVEGDWGGKDTRAVCEVLPGLLRLFERYSVTATFFVVANLISYIKGVLLADGPHEIGSHGMTHLLLSRLAPRDLVFEVEESKRVIEEQGYRVTGFRAPFLKSPPGLPDILAGAGYEYDASCGSVYPTPLRNWHGSQQWDTTPKIFRVGTSTLRDGMTPFSLTYLRFLHPIGLRLVPAKPRHFSFHLHELLEDSQGWQRAPSVLRWLHMRNSGAAAWYILEKLFKRFDTRFVSCREYFDNLTSG